MGKPREPGARRGESGRAAAVWLQSWEVELQRGGSDSLPLSPHISDPQLATPTLYPQPPRPGARRQRWVCALGPTRLGAYGYQVRSPRGSRPLPAWARGWRKGPDSADSEGKETLFAAATGGRRSGVPAHCARVANAAFLEGRHFLLSRSLGLHLSRRSQFGPHRCEPFRAAAKGNTSGPSVSSLPSNPAGTVPRTREGCRGERSARD